jgi:hypothetical protein
MNLGLRLFLAFALMTSCSGHGVESPKTLTPDSSAGTEQSAKRASSSMAANTGVVQNFVQEFYNWYVPAAVKNRSVRSSDLALSSRLLAFDPSLAAQLKEDSNAQAKVHDDIVGLDFDPFLAAQDHCERYEVVNVETQAESYLAGVRGVGGCEKHDGVDVIAEVGSRNGTLSFVNFRYPAIDNSDLLTVLKKLRDARGRSERCE